MKLKRFTTLMCCWYITILHAQPATHIKPLTIGDTLPAVTIENVINHSAGKINLAHLKGKLVILDFWSSWCGACISLFPHMQQLQNRFADSIAIILVNTKSHLSKDDAAKINTILSNVHRRTGSKISLPVSFSNPLLDQYFPSNILPHEVWISPGGTVQAITSWAELNEANISAVLQGNAPAMSIKKDNTGYDPSKPLFVKGNGGIDTALRFRSLLCGYLPGLGGRIGVRRKNNLISGTYLINQPLQVLVRSAYTWSGNFPDNRTIVLLNNTKYNTTITDPENKTWIYSYELTIPPATDSMLRIYMQQDMQRYFNLKVYTVKKWVPCLVIKPTVKTKTGSPHEPALDIEKQTLKKFIYNYPAATALEILNRYTSIPVILEAIADPGFSVNLPFDLSNTSSLAASFEAAGFTTSFSTRQLDMLVVTDSTVEIQL